jgi:hypothetical protein
MGRCIGTALSVLVAVLFGAEKTSAVFEIDAQDARISALGGAGVALAPHAVAVVLNPASTVGPGDRLVSLTWRKPFSGLGGKAIDGNSLSVGGLAGRWPLSRTTAAAFSLSYLGADAWSEMIFRAAYARSVGSRLNVGLATRFSRWSAGTIGGGDPLSGTSKTLLSADAGLTFDLGQMWSLDGTRLGLVASDILQPDAGSGGGGSEPMVLTAGLSTRVGDVDLFLVDVLYENPMWELRAGAEHRVIARRFQWLMRAGFWRVMNGEGFEMNLGLGFSVGGGIIVDYTVGIPLDLTGLGNHHYATLGYRW